MNTRFAIVAGIVLLGITALAVLVPVPHPSSISTVAKTVESKTKPSPTTTASANNKVPEFYGENVGAALFARPLPPREAPVSTQTETAPPAPPHPTPFNPPAPDDFAEYVYSGTITADGQKLALLENSRTKAGLYLHQGDAFLGATIAKVEDNAVTLNVHGKMRRIPKSTAYNVVPLNTQANASMDKNARDFRNWTGSQTTALASGAEQQWAADVLSQAFSEGNVQATVSSTGDGGAVIFSLSDASAP